MSKHLKFPLESRADGEGKLVRWRNIKSASFHARSDSEIYTTEYSSIGNMRKNPSCKGRTRDLARINHARDARRIPYFPCAIVAPSEVFVVLLLLACLVAIAAATQPRGGRWRLWVGGWLAVEGPSTVGVGSFPPCRRDMPYATYERLFHYSLKISARS